METIKAILNQLRNEIRLYESFEESALHDLSVMTDDELVALPFRASVSLFVQESAYQELYKRYPFLPLKIKSETFQSWVILHKKDDLYEIINLPSIRPQTTR